MKNFQININTNLEHARVLFIQNLDFPIYFDQFKFEFPRRNATFHRGCYNNLQNH